MPNQTLCMPEKTFKTEKLPWKHHTPQEKVHRMCLFTNQNEVGQGQSATFKLK